MKKKIVPYSFFAGADGRLTGIRTARKGYANDRL